MSRAGNLLRLQETDLELDACHARTQAINAILSDTPAIRAAQQALAAAEARLTAAHRAAKNIDLDAQSLAAKIAEVEQRLYSGRVTNPKELRDLEKDSESLKRQRGTLEEKQLDALIEVETAEAEQRASQTALQQAEAQTAKTQGDLIAEKTALGARREKLEGEREAVLAAVSAPDRELYDRLRPAKKGRPVSRLEDGICTACGVAPSSSRGQSARQGNDLIQCGNCNRILCAD